MHVLIVVLINKSGIFWFEAVDKLLSIVNMLLKLFSLHKRHGDAWLTFASCYDDNEVLSSECNRNSNYQ